MIKSNSDDDENGWHKDNNSNCNYQLDDDKDSFVCSAGMVQSKDKKSCTNGLGGDWGSIVPLLPEVFTENADARAGR